ncbi:11334_t:CDS:2, partial [Racocetra persica]
IAINELPKLIIDLQKSKYYVSKIFKKFHLEEVSSQETFKGERTFEKETFIHREHAARYVYGLGKFEQCDKTSTEMIPQDLYMDVHEAKIFILDLENLNDEKYSPKVMKSSSCI